MSDPAMFFALGLGFFVLALGAVNELTRIRKALEALAASKGGGNDRN